MKTERFRQKGSLNINVITVKWYLHLFPFHLHDTGARDGKVRQAEIRSENKRQGEI
jgi:hypothetical protein